MSAREMSLYEVIESLPPMHGARSEFSALLSRIPPCVCGEPTLGVVHRADGPCYLPAKAPPAAVANAWCSCEPKSCEGVRGCRWYAMGYSPAPPAAAPARMKVPRTLTPEMREVLTRMLTDCRTVDESYGELLAAAAKGNDNG